MNRLATGIPAALPVSSTLLSVRDTSWLSGFESWVGGGWGNVIPRKPSCCLMDKNSSFEQTQNLVLGLGTIGAMLLVAYQLGAWLFQLVF